jgi:hypothetical protein
MEKKEFYQKGKNDRINKKKKGKLLEKDKIIIF